MKQQNGFRGGWLLFPLLLIVLALVFMPGRKQNELSYQQFKQVLESGDVGSLIIYQNEQTPTGEVRLANHAGEVYVTYVSDVNQTQKMLQDMDWERVAGYLKPAVEAQIRRLVSGMLTEQETRSLSGCRELLIDFLTVSVIQYIFRYISSRKVQKEQNAASLRELLQICSLLCAKCSSSSENKDEVYIKNRIKTA